MEIARGHSQCNREIEEQSSPARQSTQYWIFTLGHGARVDWSCRFVLSARFKQRFCYPNIIYITTFDLLSVQSMFHNTLFELTLRWQSIDFDNWRLRLKRLPMVSILRRIIYIPKCIPLNICLLIYTQKPALVKNMNAYPRDKYLHLSTIKKE